MVRMPLSQTYPTYDWVSNDPVGMGGDCGEGGRQVNPVRCVERCMPGGLYRKALEGCIGCTVYRSNDAECRAGVSIRVCLQGHGYNLAGGGRAMLALTLHRVPSDLPACESWTGRAHLVRDHPNRGR